MTMLGALAFLAMHSIDLNIHAQVAIAALAGLPPLVLTDGAGAHSQQSLGTMIFGDLAVATVLPLGVIHPVYALVKNLENRCFQSAEPEWPRN